jgi:hypothetical protein
MRQLANLSERTVPVETYLEKGVEKEKGVRIIF